MDTINQLKFREIAVQLEQKGMRCERIGPLCFSILGNDKAITLSVWEGTWFLETMGALGYKAPENSNVADLCYECLCSQEFKMSRIPQELIHKYSLEQLSDAEFSKADAALELDEEELPRQLDQTA